MRRRLGAATLLVLVLALAGLWLVPRGGFGWGPNLSALPTLPDSGVMPESPSEPDDSYAARLAMGEVKRAQLAQARTSLRANELRWLVTPQDARVAFLVSEQTGFDSWGLETQLAEIPVGWHTGRHRHGEEAVFVVSGEGLAVVDGVGYEFRAGTTLGIPFGAEHQFYNRGTQPVRYVSATPFPLERHLGLYQLEQLATCGPTDALPALPKSSDGRDPAGRRIRLFWEDALFRDGSPGVRARLERSLRVGLGEMGHWLFGAPLKKGREAELASRLEHHAGWIRTMGEPGQRGFANRLVSMSGLLLDDPGGVSGKHAHMEAVLYVVSGSGHSVIDGVSIPWEAGTSLHVQGPQTWHQHFNTGTEPSLMLRIVSGWRESLQDTVDDVYPMLWAEGHTKRAAEEP